MAGIKEFSAAISCTWSLFVFVFISILVFVLVFVYQQVAGVKDFSAEVLALHLSIRFYIEQLNNWTIRFYIKLSSDSHQTTMLIHSSPLHIMWIYMSVFWILYMQIFKRLSKLDISQSLGNKIQIQTENLIEFRKLKYVQKINQFTTL